jgi:hypothetical protein
MSAPAAPLEPIALPIAKAVAVSGLSRSALYRELAAGNLRAVKHGTRTLVLVDSIRDFVSGLPEAQFRGTRPSDTPPLTARSTMR